MNAELAEFLKEIGFWMLIGAAVGLMIRWARPSWCRRWTKFVLNRQWKLFLLGALFFGGGAIMMWRDGRMYHAALSLALCVLEIVALSKCGFKPLTPEMARRIDES